MDFTWLFWAAIAGMALMIALEKKTPWWGRALASIVALGFVYNAAVALFDPDAWLSWLGILLAVGITIRLRGRRNQGSSEDLSDDDENDG